LNSFKNIKISDLAHSPSVQEGIKDHDEDWMKDENMSEMMKKRPTMLRK